MKPGRNLDALVAEKVMGWAIMRGDITRFHPSEVGRPILFLDDIGEPRLYRTRESSPTAWSPSTDIAAAWEVVDRIGRNPGGFPFLLEMTYSGGWICDMPTRDIRGHITADADTAPYAICLASLKAVGAI